MTALICTLIICAPLLIFAIRAAAEHVRANRKRTIGQDADDLIAYASRNPKIVKRVDRRIEFNRCEEHRVKREMLRKLLASGGILKR